jgi:hypothetical protein
MMMGVFLLRKCRENPSMVPKGMPPEEKRPYPTPVDQRMPSVASPSFR